MSLPKKWCAFLLILALLVPSAVRAQPVRVSADARSAWGFGRTDLAPHPDVRFGVLPNGMRYALMRNTAPEEALSVRLHIGAGAMVEGEREQGFMHLVEHMIFHGSTNIPEGALPMMLSHAGLRRWTDFNAFTSFDETLFQLDLAKSDDRARQTALTLAREISSGLLFGPRAVEGAKRMVRTEIRGRDAVQDQLLAAQNSFFFPGSPLAGSSVASTEASVKRAQGSVLQRLYQAHYVPGSTTLIFVGDFDPDLLEREIAARFSDWPARPVPIRTRFTAPASGSRPSDFGLFVNPAADTSVTIAAAEPLGGGDAAKGRDSLFLAHLGIQMLNRRLARSAAAPDAAFSRADAALYDHFSTGRLARMDIEARDRDWRRALQAGEGELRRALARGFEQRELDEQLALSRKTLSRVASPRTSRAIADAIAEAVGRGVVFTQAGDASATDAYLARVRLGDVNAAFKAAWASPERLVFVAHNRPISRAVMAQAIAASDYSPGL